MHGYDAEAARRLREIEAREAAGEAADERSIALYGELPEAVWGMTEREFHDALDELAYDWTEEHDYFRDDWRLDQ